MTRRSGLRSVLKSMVGGLGLVALLTGCNGQGESSSSTTTSSSTSQSSASSMIRVATSSSSSSSQPLSFDPSVTAGSEVQLAVSGGTSPYTFVVSGCDSTVDASSGLFTAGSAGTSCVVTVTDSASATAVLDINVVASSSSGTGSSGTSAPALKGGNFLTYVGASFTLPVFGGTAPYTFAISGCDSTIDASSGAFVAGSDVSTCAVTVTDSASNSITDQISVVSVDDFNQAAHQGNAPGGGSSGNGGGPGVDHHSRLLIGASSSQVLEGGSVQINAMGGSSPYTYAVSGCDSTIDSSSGVFTASVTAAACSITVTDSSNRTAQFTLNVVDSSATATNALKAMDKMKIREGGTRNVSVFGGVLPYSYAVSGCDSTISSAGLFTAASDASTCSVTITDAIGASASVSVDVTE